MNAKETEMYRVTYCNDIANHGYGYKYFETKEEALKWCKNHIGGLHTREYEKLIDFCSTLEKEACEFAVLKTTILKLRNCMNCKFRDIGGHSGCEDKGVVLCNHWEMKE